MIAMSAVALLTIYVAATFVPSLIAALQQLLLASSVKFWDVGTPALLVISVLGASVYVTLPDATAKKTKISANVATLAGLTFTWGAAGAFALWRYGIYRTSAVDNAGGQAIDHFLLVVGFTGGLLAVQRSNRTNAATVAGLHELSSLREERHVSRELLSLGALSLQTDDRGVLIVLLERMLEHALPLSMQDEGRGLTVWEKAGEEWRILVGRGVNASTIDHFRQPVLSEVKPGAGVVSNMAAARSMFFTSSDAPHHEWYAHNEYGSDWPALAAVMIPDSSTGEAIGAICYTTKTPSLVPVEGSAEYDKVRNMLNVWLAAFSLPVQRLKALEEP
ncbi:MAG: hypothetical protein Q8P18_14070 [Pseudomonadota bacterium]|nr:hypothetical protein [Pseudomonadota bacterium]